MNQTTITANATISSGERWLARLGIRPDDRRVTLLLFSNMFLSGITLGMIRVCAYTLFLARFSAQQLALVAISWAIVGTVVTLVISWLTRHFSIRGYIFTLLATMLVSLVAYRTLLGTIDANWLIFSLPIWFELIYMMSSLQFMALLARLLDVRQTKRLAGLARSGEFAAELVGGLSIAILLKFIDVQDLLLVATASIVLVFVIVQMTITTFPQRLLTTTEDLASEEAKRVRLTTLLKQPYIRFISFCYAAFIFAYYFLDVAFYDYASSQFSSERELAAFLGQFFAVSGVLTLLSLVFLYAPFLRKFGILAGVIAFPIVIAVGSTLVSLMEFADLSFSIIFVVMILTNGMRIVLQASIWRPSVSILFQVLPDKQRMLCNSLIEGIIDPLAAGAAGICLYFLTNFLGWSAQSFLLLLAAMMVAWVVAGFVIRRLYLSNLVISLQKRRLGELALSELDNASLDIIKGGLKSEYSAEVFYCLNLLEQIEYPDLATLISDALDNEQAQVRMDSLRRVERLHLADLAGKINDLIDTEPEPEVLGQALITYASTAGEDVIERLDPFLHEHNQFIQKGAMVGMLRFDVNNDMVRDRLLELVRSEHFDYRKFAALVLGEIGLPAFSGYLTELLDDPDRLIVKQAIIATGSIKDPRLVNSVIDKLSDPALQPTASLALAKLGEQVIDDLDDAFTQPYVHRAMKIHIVAICRELGGQSAIDMLLQYVEIDIPEVRHQVILSLAALHYQADPDDKYLFVNLLDNEVRKITWILAAMEDLYQVERFRLVHEALGNELDLRRDDMLLLISFILPSIVMLDTRANIDSKVSELRTFALEVLDNLLTGDIKEIVLPVLDDLSVRERLEYLNDKFPQERLEPVDRFIDIVRSHFEEAYCWTRACLIFQIGKDRVLDFERIVVTALDDQEAIVRETSLWAISQLKPQNLQGLVRSHADDPASNVREVAAAILENRPIDTNLV